MDKCKIKWECNNWYKNDLGLVYIVNQSGSRIILSGVQSEIWESINYQTHYDDLKRKLMAKGHISVSCMEEVLDLFEKNKLISVMEESELFNSIFG